MISIIRNHRYTVVVCRFDDIIWYQRDPVRASTIVPWAENDPRINWNRKLYYRSWFLSRILFIFITQNKRPGLLIGLLCLMWCRVRCPVLLVIVENGLCCVFCCALQCYLFVLLVDAQHRQLVHTERYEAVQWYVVETEMKHRNNVDNAIIPWHGNDWIQQEQSSSTYVPGISEYLHIPRWTDIRGPFRDQYEDKTFLIYIIRQDY